MCFKLKEIKKIHTSFQVGAFYGVETRWASCGDLSVEQCGAPQLDDSIYYLLYCALDQYGPCRTEEDCLERGAGCSDFQQSKWDWYDAYTQRAMIQYASFSLFFAF